VVGKHSSDLLGHEEKRPLQKMKKGVQVNRISKNIKHQKIEKRRK